MRKLFAFVALLAATPALAERKEEEIGLLSAALADAITTEVWLHHDPWLGTDGQMHYPSEGVSPILKGIDSPAGRIAVKMGGATGMLFFARVIEKKSPKAARVIRWMGISVWSGYAAFNVSLAVGTP